MGINAYMDDTNQLLGNNKNNLLAPLLPNAQANIDLWQGLIQASGSTLNLTKCSWTPFLWVFDQLGNAHLAEPPDWPSYHIMAPDHQGCRHTLIHNSPSKAVCLLGVNIAPTVIMLPNSASLNNDKHSTATSFSAPQ